MEHRGVRSLGHDRRDAGDRMVGDGEQHGVGVDARARHGGRRAERDLQSPVAQGTCQTATEATASDDDDLHV